jgi:hypothetical protein
VTSSNSEDGRTAEQDGADERDRQDHACTLVGRGAKLR